MKALKIETKRLRIRNLQITDLDAFLQYRANPEVAKYQGYAPMNREQASTFIHAQKDKHFGKPGEWVQYGLESVLTQQIIGDCAIKLHTDVRIASIGISISHLSQRQGFAKEALIGVLDFLFAQEDFHRVEEIVDAENMGSIRLLESIGFRQEGHFIENIFFKGKWGSELQYAMLKSEWLKNPHKP